MVTAGEPSHNGSRFTITFPENLPISQKRDEIVAAIRAHQVVVISGETGSGKTTQLPKMCLEAGLGLQGKIGCTQPRRIAALSVSRRIAEETNCTWGREVGCKIRFSDHTKKDTVIKVMTDGILLAETKSDPLLDAYEAIIIDEAHERSLTIDFLLGYLNRLRKRRPNLKIIITSATIDTQLFSKAFDDAPIFEVSGRLYPVEIRYEPLSVNDDEAESISYVDAAVGAAEAVLCESSEGDVLVFMPSERDIREARDRLSGRLGQSVEVLPLMGSLSASDQERVFRSSGRRKVVIATNIAETSLTIPSIKYVVDTGLARVSRYNPRTRTKRLPIEKIAKSSANQRAGRAGRVQEGVCIRLYDQADFDSRQEFTDPEIVRANLAEVILRMKAFDLGEVTDFPFLNPPDPRAVRSGYALLQELGALDENQKLTGIGRELSRLPVDPTIGRMLLQSRREHVVSEALVIAAGLSIQDPRERPLDKKDKAEEAQRKFAHPDSDFLTLVNIWNAYREQSLQSKGQGLIRKFCKEHFLSYMRMREWTDLYAELAGALGVDVSGETCDIASIKRFDGQYRAIHRSIVAGLLGQVAFRIDKNTYRAGGGRELTISPGSSLSERLSRSGEPSGRNRHQRRDPSKEQWVVAAEIVETSKLFARTVARIVPQWIEELGKHLSKRTVEDPQWNADQSMVTAQERVTLQGLTISYRRVPYVHVNPVEAREMLVRHALVCDDSLTPFAFVQANRKLCDKLASRLAYVGKLNRAALEESLVEFYVSHLPPIGSLRDLEESLRGENPKVSEDALYARPEQLWGGRDVAVGSTEFPDQLDVAGTRVEVHYRYDPGNDRDGVTLSVPLALAERLPPRALDGAIPGLREQQIFYLLRRLPKQYRLQLDAFAETARVIVSDDVFKRKPLLEGLVDALWRCCGVQVPLEAVSLEALPNQLRPRIEVASDEGILVTTRDLSSVQDHLASQEVSSDAPRAWESIRRKWEREAIASWDLGDLPEEIEVTRISGVPVSVFPAVVSEEDKVALRLLETRDEAIASSKIGLEALARIVLNREFQDLAKQSRGADQLKPYITLFCTVDQLREGVMAAAAGRLFEREQKYPLTQHDFESLLTVAKQRIPDLIPTILLWARQVLELRRAVIDVKRAYPGMREDLNLLVPVEFLSLTPFEKLRHLPRYLKAMIIRAERADSDPRKDRERAIQLDPYLQLLRRGDANLPQGFSWMVEEFKVSLFAQELGTEHPISAARLDKALAAGGKLEVASSPRRN